MKRSFCVNPKPLPESAYYEPRKRYRAEKILEYLYSLRTDKNEKIVGLTSSDISTTKDPYDDWGIFGMALSQGQHLCRLDLPPRRGKSRHGPFS